MQNRQLQKMPKYAQCIFRRAPFIRLLLLMFAFEPIKLEILQTFIDSHMTSKCLRRYMVIPPTNSLIGCDAVEKSTRANALDVYSKICIKRPIVSANSTTEQKFSQFSRQLRHFVDACLKSSNIIISRVGTLGNN